MQRGVELDAARSGEGVGQEVPLDAAGHVHFVREALDAPAPPRLHHRGRFEKFGGVGVRERGGEQHEVEFSAVQHHDRLAHSARGLHHVPLFPGLRRQGATFGGWWPHDQRSHSRSPSSTVSCQRSRVLWWTNGCNARNPVLPMLFSRYFSSANLSCTPGSGGASNPASRIIRTPFARIASSACNRSRHIMSTITSAGKRLWTVVR